MGIDEPLDDDDDLRETIQTVLEHAGYEVACASEGRRGLELHRNAPVDIVITDIFMPETDGIETIQRLRREFPTTKIIAMSGGGMFNKPNNYLTTARRLGAHCVLTKPFDAATLLDAVASIIGQPHAATAGC